MYTHLCRVVDILEDLAKARTFEFAFVMQPLKLQGATGSTVAPTVIRSEISSQCPLSGVKRTKSKQGAMSAYDCRLNRSMQHFH
jgi:hypothetical protein